MQRWLVLRRALIHAIRFARISIQHLWYVGLIGVCVPLSWRAACNAVLAWQLWMEIPSTQTSSLATIYYGCSEYPFTDSCDPVCLNISTALSTCSDSGCLCPTVLASGLQCSSCLNIVDADPADATALGSLYTSCAASPVPSQSQSLPSATGSQFNHTSQMPITSTAVIRSQSTAFFSTVFVQSKSSTSGADIILRDKYVKIIMLVATVVGLFCVYI